MLKKFGFVAIMTVLNSYGTEPSKGFHVQAHRGSSAQLLENTIPAILESARQGAHSIEFDVHLSADNEWIMFHDFHLPIGCCYIEDKSKTNLEEILIRSKSSKDLQKFKILPAFSKRLVDPLPIENEYKLASLEDLMIELIKLEKNLGRNVTLDIEIKSNVFKPEESAPPELLAEKIAEFLKRHKRESKFLVRSFDLRVLKHLQEILPQVRMAVLSDKDVGDYITHAKGLRAEILAPYAAVLSRENIKLAHAQGYKVIPWTVNDPAQIQKLKSMGVDGVTTDHPQKILKLFQ